MLIFTIRRILVMIPTLILVSIVSFGVIKLQPGSFGSQFLENPRFSRESVAVLTEQLGLNDPGYVQYWKWVSGIVTRGDFGRSFVYNRPVSELIWERLGWTVVIAGSTLLFTWLVAVPLGIFVARRRYSFWDHLASVIGFLGLAVPDFLMALILMWLVLQLGGTAVGGLFAPQYIGEPWTWGKVGSFLAHIWIPLIAIGTSGIAGLMRQMRGNLLDTLSLPYVRTARAKGLSERVVVNRHAVRNAINPLVTIAGLSLPALISGEIITAIVLNLPSMGPFLYSSLLNYDQYVVMTLLMFSAVLLMVGNLLADLALAFVDPRVRYG